MDGDDVVFLDPFFCLLPVESGEISRPLAAVVFDAFLATRIRVGFIPRKARLVPFGFCTGSVERFCGRGTEYLGRRELGITRKGFRRELRIGRLRGKIRFRTFVRVAGAGEERKGEQGKKFFNHGVNIIPVGENRMTEDDSFKIKLRIRQTALFRLFFALRILGIYKTRIFRQRLNLLWNRRIKR